MGGEKIGNTRMQGCCCKTAPRHHSLCGKPTAKVVIPRCMFVCICLSIKATFHLCLLTRFIAGYMSSNRCVLICECIPAGVCAMHTCVSIWCERAQMLTCNMHVPVYSSMSGCVQLNGRTCVSRCRSVYFEGTDVWVVPC